jgi:hypothetical protein
VSAPRRIQLRRIKGWRKPEGAVSVARPSMWGNPYRVGTMADIYGTHYPLNRGALVVWHQDRKGYKRSGEWSGFTDREEATRFAVDLFRRSLLAVSNGIDGALHLDYYLGELRGHDLGCWCPLDAPCHADVLLKIANQADQ